MTHLEHRFLQIKKDEAVNPGHIVLATEGDAADGETVGILHLSNGSMVWADPAYWPAVKTQIWPTPQQIDVLAALRYLDEFAVTYNISTDIRTLEIPEGKTVSEVLIALAKALQEKGVKAP